MDATFATCADGRCYVSGWPSGLRSSVLPEPFRDHFRGTGLCGPSRTSYTSRKHGLYHCVFFALAEFHHLFGITHDTFLILGMTVVTVLVLEQLWDTCPSLKQSVPSGVPGVGWWEMPVLRWRSVGR